MLDGDGLAACRALQKEFGPLPVIFVTDWAAGLDQESGLTIVPRPFAAADIAAAQASISTSAASA